MPRYSTEVLQELRWTWTIGDPGSMTSTTKSSNSSTSARGRPPDRRPQRQQDPPYYVPEREAADSRSSGRPPAEVRCRARGDPRHLARDPLRLARALEHPLPVAYLGAARAPSRTRPRAALRLLRAATPARARSPRSSTRSSAAAREFGVVPVENSTEGAVNVTLDRLIDSDVHDHAAS